MDKIFDVLRRRLTLAEDRIVKNGLSEGNSGMDTSDEVLAKGSGHAVESKLASSSSGDDFPDHAVIYGGMV